MLRKESASFRNKDTYENTTTIGIIYFQMVNFQIQSHADNHHNTYFHNTIVYFY